MKIGIIGLGVVGSANATGFTLINHEVVQHDIKFDTTIHDVLDTEIVFLCLPTPEAEGKCDTSILESVINELESNEYNGIVCIRSTVEPGFTESMIDTHQSLTICCAPEFLRERAAADDFINNHALLAVGTDDPYVFQKITEAHGHLPKNTKQLSPTEAEILKYFNNAYAALRIVFANVFYELCEKLDCDYSSVKDAYALTGKTKNIYLDVNKRLRGYGGMCLPKDVNALASTLDKLELEFGLINSIDADNEKFKSTTFSGMRK
jgi:UDPglucose 6-dehydrogenase